MVFFNCSKDFGWELSRMMALSLSSNLTSRFSKSSNSLWYSFNWSKISYFVWDLIWVQALLGVKTICEGHCHVYWLKLFLDPSFGRFLWHFPQDHIREAKNQSTECFLPHLTLLLRSYDLHKLLMWLDNIGETLLYQKRFNLDFPQAKIVVNFYASNFIDAVISDPVDSHGRRQL